MLGYFIKYVDRVIIVELMEITIKLITIICYQLKRFKPI
jgi:hypothetical protein